MALHQRARFRTPATRGLPGTPRRVVGRQCRRCRGGPGGRGDRVRRGRQRPGSGGLDAPRGHQAAAGPHSTWPLAEAFNGITVYGVLARTVADAALVLDAVSGNVEGTFTSHRRCGPVTVWTCLGGRCGSQCRPASRSPSSAPSCTRDSGCRADHGRPACRPRPHRGRARPRLRAASVGGFPVPLHLRARRMERPPRRGRQLGSPPALTSAWAG